MAKSTIKSLAATTAITLATVGTPAFAEEVTPTVEATNDAVVSTTEAPKAEATKTSADVKPALDAQTQVVSDVKGQVDTAQDAATQADQAQATAQADVATATEAVKDAETNAANATPENIEANQADQAANLADQEANVTETDEVNAEIASQTQTVADAKTAVDTAQAEKDTADADVTAAEDNVKSAQDAISGTGLAEAQANLDQAKADVQNAETNVATATDAVATAKQADADRQTKIDAATTDVAVKSDAVDTSKAVLTKAQDDVASTTDKLTQTTDAVNDAQDALVNVDVVTVNVDSNFKSDLDNWKKDPSEDNSDFLKDSGFNSISASTLKVGANDAKSAVDVNNLTKANQLDMSFIYVDAVNQLRKQLGLQTVATVTDNAITIAQDRAEQYKQRGTNPVTTGHIPGAVENLARLGSIDTLKTVEDIKNVAWQAFLATSFDDSKSNWNHLTPNMYANGGIGLSIANINGQYWLVIVLANDGTPITNPEDPATLQAALAQAQADQAQAQAASDAAKAQLTKASSDYATALEVKTAAEKVLAEATATPLQTQVAENNLRLAKIALQNAQAREVEAQKAVDNFSADLATKKAALDDAKAKLADAQAVQASKTNALEVAKAELTKQEATLASLNAEKEALLAEKDRLVEEAKALATELKGYLEAPAILEKAKAELSDKEATLKEAIAKAEVAHNALKDLSVKLAEEESKLAELQAEYDRLKDLEDKAKDNVITVLPDGTVITVTKDTPTVGEKPALDPALLVAKTNGGKGKAGVTVTPQGITYSRVARAKALPQTGEQESLLALFGVAVLSSLGLTGARRKRRG